MISDGYKEEDFDPDSIVWLTVDEQPIAYGFILSLMGGMNGAEVNYDFTKDFCTQENLDVIDTYGLFRKMAAEFNAGISSKKS